MQRLELQVDLREAERVIDLLIPDVPTPEE